MAWGLGGGMVIELSGGGGALPQALSILTWHSPHLAGLCAASHRAPIPPHSLNRAQLLYHSSSKSPQVPSPSAETAGVNSSIGAARLHPLATALLAFVRLRGV